MFIVFVWYGFRVMCLLRLIERRGHRAQSERQNHLYRAISSRSLISFEYT